MLWSAKARAYYCGMSAVNSHVYQEEHCSGHSEKVLIHALVSQNKGKYPDLLQSRMVAAGTSAAGATADPDDGASATLHGM